MFVTLTYWAVPSELVGTFLVYLHTAHLVLSLVAH
jgi:hypothetical protein